MYKINIHNISFVETRSIILTESCNCQLRRYVLDVAFSSDNNQYLERLVVNFNEMVGSTFDIIEGNLHKMQWLQSIFENVGQTITVKGKHYR